MEKLTMPQIVGSMDASLFVIGTRLIAMLHTYGENIPSEEVREVYLEILEREQKHKEQWENRV